MTAAELSIIDKLVDAHRIFTSLPVQHPRDKEEWCEKLHDLQRMVMARDAVRTHSGYFTNMFDKGNNIETVSPEY